MKIIYSRQKERGSAMLVVLVLLILLSMLAIGNGLTLHGLQDHLRRIDHAQQKRLSHPVEQKRWVAPEK